MLDFYFLLPLDWPSIRSILLFLRFCSFFFVCVCVCVGCIFSSRCTLSRSPLVGRLSRRPAVVWCGRCRSAVATVVTVAVVVVVVVVAVVLVVVVVLPHPFSALLSSSRGRSSFFFVAASIWVRAGLHAIFFSHETKKKNRQSFPPSHLLRFVVVVVVVVCFPLSSEQFRNRKKKSTRLGLKFVLYSVSLGFTRFFKKKTRFLLGFFTGFRSRKTRNPSDRTLRNFGWFAVENSTFTLFCVSLDSNFFIFVSPSYQKKEKKRENLLSLGLSESLSLQSIWFH